MMRLGTLGPPHNPGPIRDGIQHHQLEDARRAGWPELDHDDLTFHRHFIEHRPSGDFYQAHRGELVDSVYSSAAAYYVTSGGELRFLERPPAGFPGNRDELAQRRGTS